MTNKHLDRAGALGTTAGEGRTPTCSRAIRSLTRVALLVSLPAAQASEPFTFLLQASGFETAIVADDRGRLVQTWPGRSQRLTANRWVAVDAGSSQSVWFDADGRVSMTGPYVEIRSPAFERNADDPDQRSVFIAWSNAGTGLLHADGSTFIGWQPGQGEWTRTAHPQRYSWRSREGERIFDQQGALRLSLKADELRVAGPFPGRTGYLVCTLATEAPCTLRDESGTVLWSAAIDDIQPLATGGWLARQGGAWRQFDAHGEPAGDRTRVHAERHAHGGRLTLASDQAPAWPRWMTGYNVEREDAQGLILDPGSAVGGLMQSDGGFTAVPYASQGEEVCPGVWRFSSPKGDWLGDGSGQPGGRFPAFSWNAVGPHPHLRLQVAENGQQTLVDCSGRLVVDTPPLDRLAPGSGGMLGTLAGESDPRLWLDAALRPHLLPKDSAIDASNPDGSLLLVRAEGGLRLYNVKAKRFVGAVMQSVDLLRSGAAFLHDGYYGFVDAEGNERLPPRYSAITSWGEDRLWTSRYLEGDASNRTEVSLHRLDGSVIKRWSDATRGDIPLIHGLQDQGPVTELIGPTINTAQGTYLGQQWVDREGRTLFLAMHCRRESPQAQGAVIEPLMGPVRRHGMRCDIPDAVRAAMVGFIR